MVYKKAFDSIETNSASNGSEHVRVVSTYTPIRRIFWILEQLSIHLLERKPGIEKRVRYGDTISTKLLITPSRKSWLAHTVQIKTLIDGKKFINPRCAADIAKISHNAATTNELNMVETTSGLNMNTNQWCKWIPTST